MAVLLARLIPWIVVLSVVFGAYKLWMWAAGGGISRMDRTRAMFLAILAIAVCVVVVSKLF